MVEAKPAGSLAASPASGAPGNPAPSPDSAQGQMVQVSEQDWKVFQERQQAQSGLIAKLERQLSKLAEAPAVSVEPAKAKDNAELTKATSELQTKFNELETRSKQLSESAKRQQVSAQFVALGFDNSAASLLTSGFLAQHGEAVTVDQGVNGFEVRVREGENAVTPLEQYISAYSQTDAVRGLLPGKRNPQAPGAAGLMTGAFKAEPQAVVGGIPVYTVRSLGISKTK